MHPTGINQIPPLSRQTTNHCAFPLPVYPTFYSLTAGQNIVQSPPTHSSHHPSRCFMPFRTSTWAVGWYVIAIPPHPRAIYQRSNGTRNASCHVPDWLVLLTSPLFSRKNETQGTASVCTRGSTHPRGNNFSLSTEKTPQNRSLDLDICSQRWSVL